MVDLVQPANEPEKPKTTSSNDPEIPVVIVIPKDQFFRTPTPEHGLMYQNFTRRHKNRRRSCCCWIVGPIALLVIVSAVFYLVFRPVTPKYSVSSISIKGLNNLSSPAEISPEFDVTVTANNPNKKIGIYYERGSSGDIYHSNVELCSGDFPVFYQPPKNATTIKTVLKGSGIAFGSRVPDALANDQSKGKITFNLRMKVPVKVKVGLVKTWTIPVKIYCDITVEKLTAKPKILSNNCDFTVKPW